MSHSFPALLAIAALLSACAPQPQPQMAATVADPLAVPLHLTEPGPVIARVGTVPIHQAWLEAMARGRSLDLDDPQQRARALDELIEYAVLVDAARSRDDMAEPGLRAGIELNALAGRANAVLGHLAAVDEPDETSLREEYEQQSAINGDLEYDVGHLLFVEREPATLAAADMAAGQSFDTVKVAYRDRAQQAVALGWIKLGQVPDEFAAALRTLETGQTTAEPVQTQYGWHVIHLRQTRSFQPPAFEQVREGIRRMLMARATRDAIETLKAQASIEIVEPAPDRPAPDR